MFVKRYFDEHIASHVVTCIYLIGSTSLHMLDSARAMPYRTQHKCDPI
jgi:hypothetical protein